jgi:hypothetical protein
MRVSANFYLLDQSFSRYYNKFYSDTITEVILGLIIEFNHLRATRKLGTADRAVNIRQELYWNPSPGNRGSSSKVHKNENYSSSEDILKMQKI